MFVVLVLFCLVNSVGKLCSTVDLLVDRARTSRV